MGNPLFNMFGQNGGNAAPFSNMANLISQFNQFRSAFQGDPEQKVKELLNSGQMTQAQFQQLSEAAKQFQMLMKG
jgi:hypothetical protein